MTNIEDFEKWITAKYGTQGRFAESLGVGQTTVSRWLAGKQRISPDYQKRIKKAGFNGVLPEPADGAVTKADLESLREEIRTQAAWLREELRKDIEAAVEGLLAAQSPDAAQ